MSNITVKVIRIPGGNVTPLAMISGSTVADALKQVGITPGNGESVQVGGNAVAPDHTLSEGDRVIVSMSAKGASVPYEGYVREIYDMSMTQVEARAALNVDRNIPGQYVDTLVAVVFGNNTTTPKENTQVKITNVTYINGTDATTLSDQDIFDHISGLAKKAKDLGELGITGPAVKANMRQIEEQIDGLKAIVDARYEG